MIDLTSVLAVYGACLSSVVFVWTIQKSRRWARVEVAFGIDKAGEDYVSGLHVSVQNKSNHVVFPRYLGVIYPWRREGIGERLKHLIRFRRWPRRIGWVHTGPENAEIELMVPESIVPGDSWNFLLPEKELLLLIEDRIRDEVIVYFQDAHGQKTYSRLFRFKERSPGVLGA